MNKRLAILGHQTRGKEVMKILEMLGGHSYSSGLLGKAKFYYYIGNYNSISYISEEKLNDSFITFTLEQFLEKFPYKVGDKVLLSGVVKIIKQARWDDINGEVIYKLETNIRGFSEEYYVHHYDLQPYKKETMKENIIDTIKENEDRYRIHVNYQFDIEVDEGEYYVVRRKQQYPKSYEDCCKILNTPIDNFISKGAGYKAELLSTFQKLLICRDAYWKIAGEQMGLGKPWEPDWSNKEQSKYVIYTSGNAICVCRFVLGNNVLAFPTEEMRDDFLKKFKERIDFCKELL